MLTGIYEQGQLVNQKDATADSIAVHQTCTGQFDCRRWLNTYNDGEVLAGTFATQEEANTMGMNISLANTSSMTYRERYNVTAGWEARHIAKDLMEMNGPDEFLSEHDDAQIAKAEARDAKPYLSTVIDDCYTLMGLR
jgi:hypothetical protein